MLRGLNPNAVCNFTPLKGIVSDAGNVEYWGGDSQIRCFPAFPARDQHVSAPDRSRSTGKYSSNRPIPVPGVPQRGVPYFTAISLRRDLSFTTPPPPSSLDGCNGKGVGRVQTGL